MAIERICNAVYATSGPWLNLARSRHDLTDSGADRARWVAWITALTPPERSVNPDYTHMCVLVGQAKDMLVALLQTLPPCPSVVSVAAGIERRIRRDELTPGTRIRRPALAKELRVPEGHVDLALADLAARGLVEIRASGHAVVTTMERAS
ncbi:GntR family transcriptional regulator [Streptomyces sp. NPDC001787]|uniref:GntR family transcriptional regulator n=1 Tax=Streptomyces sp. NPDC001787 TaxID=3154523 RepID=UPI0033259C1C